MSQGVSSNRATGRAAHDGDGAGGRAGELLGRALNPLAAVMRAPLASYHVVVVVSCLLTVIGLGMVLASSNVLAFSGGGTPFDIFLRQALFIAIGWVGFVFALRIDFSTLTRVAPWLLGISVVLLVAVLVPGVGSEVNGSRGWISLGFFSIQPAEIAKLAFIVWCCSSVARKMRTGYWLDMLWPSVFVFGVVAGLVVIAPDLGMATAITLAYLCILWFAGYPARHFRVVMGVGLVAFVIMALTMSYRFDRLRTFVNTFVGDFSNPQGDAYQSYQGMLSLADGGLFGVGLGQSSAKWFYLPEATNDFIFAIIGEELGWVGASFVVAIYLVLGWAGIRVAIRSVDPFRRLLAGAITCSIVLQAFINIGYVVGLLPVTGLQLPLISNGGTSAVVTLTALGLLANCARHEPEAISAILSAPAARRRRWFSLPQPVPYTPERVLTPGPIPGRSSAGGGARRYGEPVVRPGRDDRPTGPRRGSARSTGRIDDRPVTAARSARAGSNAVPTYQSMPVAPRPDQRRGATPMTGRTARPVRDRERLRVEQDRLRARRAASDQAAGSSPVTRPTPINRGRDRR